MIKRVMSIFLSCGVVILMLFGCGQSKELTEEQMICEHQWTSVEWDVFNGRHDLYCPKCKLEETVTNKEWNKIKVNMSLSIE